MYPMKKRRAPTPHELRLQLQGAVVVLGFIREMRQYYPIFWNRAAGDVIETLYETLAEKADDKVHATSLWKLLLTQKPDRQPEAAHGPAET